MFRLLSAVTEAPTDSLDRMIWITSAIVLALGLALCRRGWFGPRVGSSPHCRRCGYELAGRDADAAPNDRCPECGADLTRRRAVAIGAPRRRPLAMVCGAALLPVAIAIAGVGAIGGGSADALIGRLPSRVLLALEPMGDDAIRRELIDRIAARGAAGGPASLVPITPAGTPSISDATALRYADRLVRRRDALLRSGDATGLDDLERLALRVIHDNVAMPDELIVRWIRGAIEGRVTATPIPPVRSGQHVPIGVSVDSSMLGVPHVTYSPGGLGGMAFVGAMPSLELELVDVEAPNHETPIRLGGRSLGTADGSPALASRVPLGLEEGTHEVTLRARLRIGVTDSDSETATWEVRVPMVVEVLPPEPASTSPIVDDALRAAVHASVQAAFPPNATLTIGGVEHRFLGSGVVAITEPLPIPLCMDILLRDDRTEHHVGFFLADADRTTHQMVMASDLARLVSTNQTVTVILRPNLELSRQSLGTVAIWGEEIVLENVPYAIDPATGDGMNGMDSG